MHELITTRQSLRYCIVCTRTTPGPILRRPGMCLLLPASGSALTTANLPPCLYRRRDHDVATPSTRISADLTWKKVDLQLEASINMLSTKPTGNRDSIFTARTHARVAPQPANCLLHLLPGERERAIHREATHCSKQTSLHLTYSAVPMQKRA